MTIGLSITTRRILSECTYESARRIISDELHRQLDMQYSVIYTDESLPLSAYLTDEQLRRFEALIKRLFPDSRIRLSEIINLTDLINTLLQQHR